MQSTGTRDIEGQSTWIRQIKMEPADYSQRPVVPPFIKVEPGIPQVQLEPNNEYPVKIEVSTMQSTGTRDIEGQSTWIRQIKMEPADNWEPAVHPPFIKVEPGLPQVKLEPMTEHLVKIENQAEKQNWQKCVTIKREPNSPPGTPTHSTTLDNITSQLGLETPDSSKTQLQFDLKREGFIKLDSSREEDEYSVQHTTNPFIALTEEHVPGRIPLEFTSNHTDPAVVRNPFKWQSTVDESPSTSSGLQHSMISLNLPQGAPETRSSVVQFQCHICNLYCPSSKALKAHRRRHRSLPFTCWHCGKGFQKKKFMEIHQRRHIPLDFPWAVDNDTHSLPPYNCVSCGFVGCDLPSLRFHITIAHAGEKKHQCKTCWQLFMTLEDLTNHELVHVSNPFTCANCFKSFPTNYELELHLQTSHQWTPHVCDICSETFGNERNLNRHKAHHWKPERCDSCGEAFHSTQLLLRHKQKQHLSGGKYPKCNICFKLFYNIFDLDHHHKDHPKYLKCHKCGKLFLKSHLCTFV